MVTVVDWKQTSNFCMCHFYYKLRSLCNWIEQTHLVIFDYIFYKILWKWGMFHCNWSHQFVVVTLEHFLSSYITWSLKSCQQFQCTLLKKTFFAMENIYITHFKITKYTYIQWFQTRILHIIVGTTPCYMKWKLQRCTFGKNKDETLLHLFCGRCKIQTYIKSITQLQLLWKNRNFIRQTFLILANKQDIVFRAAGSVYLARKLRI